MSLAQVRAMFVRCIPTFLLLLFPSVLAANEHWSLKPLTRPTPPALESAWIRNPIDAFILERLTRAALKPAPEADPATLIRRVTFDLIGLPPTPQEVEDFVASCEGPPAKAQVALEQLVDRLLASPRYGERWGRHWLDVVRYAESEGFEYDRFRPGAWRFRDYVIESLNSDVPFNRFLREQVAGDEIAASSKNLGTSEKNRLLIAAGFHRLGPVRRNAGNKLVAFSRNEVLTEMTDAIGTTFLGLTMGCARCHDHRFDDITQRDYYRLQAYLASAQEFDLVLGDPKSQSEWERKTKAIQDQIKALQKEMQGKANKPLEARIASLRKAIPEPLPTISTVRNVAEYRTPIHVLKRGDADRKGEPVGPRPLSMLVKDDVSELPAGTENLRTHLATWLTDPNHPLVPRVFVNRIWQGHFGAGIVATSNDFGVNGASPSHPELLDWLTSEFLSPTSVRDAGTRQPWTLKRIHRLIVLSSTYRQRSIAADPLQTKRIDPDNRLLSHFARRRLSAEEIRDAMLSVSGRLNLKSGGPSVMVPVEAELINLLYDPLAWAVAPDEREHDRRTIYLAAKRNLHLPFAQTFDQPDGQISCARRESSTHSLQALELLNGKLSNRLAEAFAKRLRDECGDSTTRIVNRAFWLSVGRGPTPAERSASLEFLRTQPLREFTLATFNLNAFLYVN